MNILKETRLDKSKISHIEIKDSFKGIDNGWGIKQYKYCQTTYIKFLRWRFFNQKAGYWENGIQDFYSSSMYTREEILNNDMYYINDLFVYTKTTVSIYVGEKLVKKLFFSDFESAKKYCDINFNNVNFLI
jgi:hypothetical protein